jgi:hypothetical protein
MSAAGPVHLTVDEARAVLKLNREAGLMHRVRQNIRELGLAASCGPDDFALLTPDEASAWEALLRAATERLKGWEGW